MEVKTKDRLKKLLAQREKKHLHYVNLVKSSDSAIISRTLGGSVISWNPAAEKLFGYSAREVIGKNILFLFPPGNEAELNKIQKIVKRGKPMEDFEAIRVRKDGTRIPIVAKISPIKEKTGKVVGLSAFIRDNTGAVQARERRKMMNAKLRQSRNNMRVILENVADGITVQNSKGKLIYANDVAAINAGYPSSREMLKNQAKWKKRFRLKSENGEPFPLKRLPGRRVLKGEANPRETVGFINRENQETKWAVIKARPIITEKGKLRAVVNIMNDITERKELERRKDDFISIASHELMTPITSIKGFMQLLKKDLKGENERISNFLVKMDNQLNKLTELIQNLLDLSKVQSGKLKYNVEKFNIGALIETAVNDIKKASNKHKIIFKNNTDTMLFGDKEKIYRILMVLIENAMKYSSNKDRVIVSAKDMDHKVEIKVKDYGVGIAEDEKDEIFDRFYRVKDSRDKTFPGFRSGLFLSREIILWHKGEIWVKSQKGRGSTFYFTLPTELK